LFAVGLHTCTAVARSLCVSWAFLFKFGFNLQKTENPVKPTGLTYTKNPRFFNRGLSVCVLVGDVLPMDEDGSAERQIQIVFDFLDEPDDLNRGLEYWGANPRHSLTELHDDDDDTQEHKTTVDSSDEDVSH